VPYSILLVKKPLKNKKDLDFQMKPNVKLISITPNAEKTMAYIDK